MALFKPLDKDREQYKRLEITEKRKGMLGMKRYQSNLKIKKNQIKKLIE